MTNRGFCSVFLVAMLTACAMDAPSLPPDTTGSTSLLHLSAADFTIADNNLSCAQIGDERDTLSKGMEQANANIASNRHTNQVAGYFGAALFPPVLLATEGNYSDKDFVKAAYQRLDVLNQLAVFKGCNG